MINPVLMRKIQAQLPDINAQVISLPIPIGISNRHVHLSEKDIEVLFGKGYQLTCLKSLKQPEQFAAKESVMIVGTKGSISKVRVLGPTRLKTQLEISKADCFTLGVKVPVRDSGDLDSSGDILMVGVAGYIYLKSQVICARRHLHMTPTDAIMFNVEDGQNVRIQTKGECSVIFDSVAVRVSPNYLLEFHIDTDEANAAGLCNNDSVNVVG